MIYEHIEHHIDGNPNFVSVAYRIITDTDVGMVLVLTWLDSVGYQRRFDPPKMSPSERELWSRVLKLRRGR